jgi:hypothetical protein
MSILPYTYRASFLTNFSNNYKLPVEVVNIIFSYADDKTKIQLRSVCKYFSTVPCKFNLIYHADIYLYCGNFANNVLFTELTNVTHLSFHDEFNDNIDHLSVLDMLKCIKFGRDFNRRVDNLPQSLEYLSFSHNSQFNQPVDCLPCSLKYLKLGYGFFQSVSNLPPQLEYLEFGSEFICDIEKIPLNLKYLVFYQYYNRYNNIISNLPRLIYLGIRSSDYNPSITLPPSIKNINYHAATFANLDQPLSLKLKKHILYVRMLCEMYNSSTVRMFTLTYRMMFGYDSPMMQYYN